MSDASGRRDGRRQGASFCSGTVCGAIALAALVLVGAPRAATADDEAKTTHVVVRGDVPAETLRRFADLAEAAYPQWTAYFGKEPAKKALPLQVDVRRDRDGFLAALRRASLDAEKLAGAGGYYDPGSATSYLYMQPHESSTRLLVLHEATHQFQAKALLGGDPGKSPDWHKEGLAEHFGFHRRTAAGVETGVLDAVCIDARPDECAERVRSGKFDAWAVGTGAVASPDYTDSLAMVGMLLRTKDASLRAALKRFEADLPGTGNPGKAFERAFSGKRERLAAATLEVWRDFRRPWKIVYVAWDEEPGAIVATGSPWAFLQGSVGLPVAKRSVEARIALGATPGRAAGIAIGCKGPGDFVGAEIGDGGRVSLRWKHRGEWSELGSATASALGKDGVRLRLSALGSMLRVEVDGLPVIDVDGSSTGLSSLDLDGAAALFAQNGPVRFVGVQTGG